ncbi:hypothetical protein F4803DRAFT_569396 [Xylaria telfairii]|nr:hypothetical protein F4803DRAFT_569396 [Xylaria telfairii]
MNMTPNVARTESPIPAESPVPAESRIPIFDRVPDEILKKILCFAMDRARYCDIKRPQWVKWEMQEGLVHDEAQKHNRSDWLAVNSTNRRFRRVGVEAFFATKTFLLTAGKLARLFTRQTGRKLPTDIYYQYNLPLKYMGACSDRRRLCLEDWQRSSEFNFYFPDRKLDFVLQTIRHVHICNVEIGWPAWWIELPERLTIFPQLRRLSGCEALSCFPLIRGFDIPEGASPEFQGFALQQRRMRALLVHYGMSEKVEFRWAMLDDDGFSAFMLQFAFMRVLDRHDLSLVQESTRFRLLNDS